MRRSEPALSPLTLSVLALAGALCYAGWATWRFSGDARASQYLYVVPIVVPFVAFIVDRISSFRKASVLELGVDTLVVGTAMMRVIGDVPYVSGHALFLSYALLRPGSSVVTRITAGLVLVEVLYLKFFAWHDQITPVTGTCLGGLSALIVWWLARRSSHRQIEAISV
jgi:hypothetical protein